MLFILYFTIALAILLLIYMQPDYIPRLVDRLRGRIPPGPLGYPIVGSLTDKTIPPWNVMDAWKKKYGPIYSMFLGSEFAVVLTDVDSIKQGLGNSALAGRPLTSIFIRFHGKAIGFSEGDPWKQRRRATLTALKMIGANSGTEMEDMLGTLAKDLVQQFRDLGTEPFYVRPQFDKAVILGMLGMVNKGALTADHPDLPRIIKAITDLNDTNASIGLLNMFPWLEYIPYFAAPIKRMEAAMKLMRDVTIRNAKARLAIPLDRDEKPTDFFDAYRIQLEDKTGKYGDELSEDQLITLCVELLMSGAEDIIVMQVWLLAYMLHYPCVQKRCQDLINQHVGRYRQVTLSDRPLLGYIDAVIAEVFRHSNNVPYPLPHRAVEEVNLMGYRIPKNTIIVPNFYSVHHDSSIWGDPEAFRPERFVDEHGNFKAYGPLLTFSTGRRMCPGEYAAKAKIFNLFCAVLQNFEIKLPPGDPLPDFSKAKYGIMIAPGDFKVLAVPR